jgi:hypothetical protein
MNNIAFFTVILHNVVRCSDGGLRKSLKLESKEVPANTLEKFLHFQCREHALLLAEITTLDFDIEVHMKNTLTNTFFNVASYYHSEKRFVMLK